MTANDSITIEYDSSVAILTFNRPAVLNAFDNELMEGTISKVNELNNNEAVRVIVVRGEGRAFSPGFDLKAAANREMRDVRDWEKQLQLQFDFIMQFWESPKPTIPAYNQETHCHSKHSFELIFTIWGLLFSETYTFYINHNLYVLH